MSMQDHDDTDQAGAITPPDEQDASQPAQQQAAGDTADAAGGEGVASIGKFLLSIPQYYQMLMGKEGQFDHLYNNGAAASATAVSKGQGMQPQGQQNPNDVSGALSGAGQQVGKAFSGLGGALQRGAQTMQEGETPVTGYAAAGNPQSQTTQAIMAPSGTTQATPPVAQGGAPAATSAEPPATQPQGNTGAQPQQPGQTASPAKKFGPPDYSDLVRMYGQDAVDEARASHQSAGQFPAMMAQLSAGRAEKLKAQYQQENTGLLVTGRNEAATIRGTYYLDANQVKADASTQNGRMRLQGQLANAQRLLGQSFNANLGKVAAAQLSSGQPLSPDLQNWLARTINQSIQGQNEQAGNNQQGGQQAAPMKNFSNAPGLGGQTRIQQAKDGQYYKVNADGVVVEGPVPAPTQ